MPHLFPNLKWIFLIVRILFLGRIPEREKAIIWHKDTRDINTLQDEKSIEGVRKAIMLFSF